MAETKEAEQDQEQQQGGNQKQVGQDQRQSEGQSKQEGIGSDSEEAKKRTDPRRKRTIRLIVLAVIVVALVVAIPVYAYYSVRESTDDAQIDGHVIPISARVSGNVLSVLINDNQQVKAGESLVKLDPADYQVAFDQARAQLATSEATTVESQENVPITRVNTTGQVSTSVAQQQQANAGVLVAEQAVNAARARVNSANATLAQAQANFVKSQKDLARYKSLVDRDEISKQDYDAAVAAADANAAQVEAGRAAVVEAQRTLDQAVAQVEQARAQLTAATVQRRQSEQTKANQQAVSAARVKQAQATVQQRKADVEQAKLNLDYTIIKAPVDGVISRKSVEPGMQISAGQQLMALVPLDDIWVTANFKETQLRKMRVGQKVEVEVDTYGSSRKYRAHIDSIAAASGAKFNLLPPENATGNYVKVVQRIPVKIVFEPGENREHRLVPGMSVTPTVLLNSMDNQ
jgi:membrane fusion protein (multidrug efflux system)